MYYSVSVSIHVILYQFRSVSGHRPPGPVRRTTTVLYGHDYGLLRRDGFSDDDDKGEAGKENDDRQFLQSVTATDILEAAKRTRLEQSRDAQAASAATAQQVAAAANQRAAEAYAAAGSAAVAAPSVQVAHDPHNGARGIPEYGRMIFPLPPEPY